MKKPFFLVAFIATAMTFNCAFSQNNDILTAPVGIGISTPNADLHIHNVEMHEIEVGHERDYVYPGYYLTTFHLTNLVTGTNLNHGFLMTLRDNDMTMQQMEKSWIKILAHNDTGIIIDSNGRIGIGTYPTGGKALNVNGNANFSNDVTVGHNLGTVNLNVSGTATISGNTYIGNGFQCTWDGHVKTKEIVVTLTGWSDYVFESDYRLMPLGELERYVKANKHLPNIPTAGDVESDGVNVGEMNALLLEKIEELTLYIIDLQKQIDELKNNK